MWLLLHACAGDPSAEALRELRAGRLEPALRRIESSQDEALGPARALAAGWPRLAEQRRKLARDSRERLRQSVEDKLARGELEAAVPHLRRALRAWPEDTAFLGFARDLGERAQELPPTQSLPLLQALVELLDHQPEQARAWAARAEQAELDAAFAEDPAQVAERLRGVSLASAQEILDRVEHEYVDVPDWAAMAGAGARRIAALQRSPSARGLWPGLSDLRAPGLSVTDRASAGEALAALVQAGGPALPEALLVDTWMTGALRSLDPWTRAVWPAELRAWQEHHAGVAVEVGLELDQEGGRIWIARPLPGSPSWESGLHQGDELLAIDTLDLGALPEAARLDAARRALFGEEGSEVQLRTRRGVEERLTRLRRAPVREEQVEGHHRGPDNAWSPWLDEARGLGYLRIRAFRPGVEDEADQLLDPVAAGLRALVLDLRGNPGGDVNAAVQLADRFVAAGLLCAVHGRVLPETGPDHDPRTGAPLAEWNEAVPGHALEGLPLVVLVDGATASSAEVLAGALQERAQALVIGSPTWGKGKAQVLRLDPEGLWGLQLTNLAWALPSGRRLQRGQGVVPTLLLGPTSPGEDFLLEWLRDQRAALRVHADGSPMRPLASAPRADLPPLDGDPALQLAELAAGLMASRDPG